MTNWRKKHKLKFESLVNLNFWNSILPLVWTFSQSPCRGPILRNLDHQSCNREQANQLAKPRCEQSSSKSGETHDKESYPKTEAELDVVHNTGPLLFIQEVMVWWKWYYGKIQEEFKEANHWSPSCLDIISMKAEVRLIAKDGGWGLYGQLEVFSAG